jgi:GT2 family glycosyltransferase
MAPLVSVVIPTRNKGHVLEQVVRSLWSQTLGPDGFEIIVIDNASTDETPARMERLIGASPVRLRYERVTADGGPAVSRNRGARLAAGSAIAFLDSDVELEPGWLEAAFDHVQHNAGTGIVAGKLLYARRRSFVNMFGGELSRIGIAWDAEEGARSTEVQTAVERLWVPTCAAMVRRDVLDRIGLFDERFYIAYEDSDLGWRANLAGLRCVCLPSLVAFHHSNPSRHVGSTFVFHYTKNRLRSMLKNYSGASLALCLPVYLLYSIADVLLRRPRCARCAGLLWNIGALADTWRERTRIQRLRRRRDRELRPYFSTRLLPARTLANRRRGELALLGLADHQGPPADPLLGKWGTK